LAAITGGIAEAYYGVPENFREKALTYLNPELRAIYDEWCDFYKNEGASGNYRVLTKYIERMSETDSFGKWIIDYLNDGTPDRPIQMPFVNFNGLVNEFVEEFYQFSESYPEYQLTRYGSILESNGLKWEDWSMRNADETSLNAQCILALIMGAIRADRFSEGTLLSFFEDGYIVKWLKRLESYEK
jgi:hypothetical protein